MQKYGFREGQGLGKHEQGLSTALSVEKTSKRGGKIIIGDSADKGDVGSLLWKRGESVGAGGQRWLAEEEKWLCNINYCLAAFFAHFHLC